MTRPIVAPGGQTPTAGRIGRGGGASARRDAAAAASGGLLSGAASRRFLPPLADAASASRPARSSVASTRVAQIVLGGGATALSTHPECPVPARQPVSRHPPDDACSGVIRVRDTRDR